MNVLDQVDERKDKIPMQTSQQSWLSISQKMKKSNSILIKLNCGRTKEFSNHKIVIELFDLITNYSQMQAYSY